MNKKTVGAMTLLESMALNMGQAHAEADKKTNRMPSSVTASGTPVACQYEGDHCVIAVRTVTQDSGAGDSTTYSYCPVSSKIVSGNSLNFCVIPKPVML